MKWRGRRVSDNIEDRRGSGGFGGRRGGGLRMRLPRGRAARRGGGIGGIGLILIVVAALYFGVDPRLVLGMLGGGGPGLVPGGSTTASAPSGPNTIDDDMERFLGVVLADTEEVWQARFREMGRTYRAPTLVLYSGVTPSACGTANAAVGPFYCPGDQRIYLDTDFFDTLRHDLGAGGDFAQAYVVAHEVAHHVQTLLGILPEVTRLRTRMSETESNAMSVRVELQADCLSGVWANRADARFGSIEAGDIEEALGAASRIGDDALMRSAGRAVVPDSFTHGSSAQRVRWFTTGWRSGDPAACDTFSAGRL